MLSLLLSLLLCTALAADPGCPAIPTLREDDRALTALAQNVKFIAGGERRAERAALLAGAVAADPAVDLLLLSEARQAAPLIAALEPPAGAGFCLYRQAGPRQGYRWARAGAPAPGGLLLGVRARAAGREIRLEGAAGRAFTSRALTFADGFLGPLSGFYKGFAEVRIDGVRLIWSHLQASYGPRDAGAGGPGRGRRGQLEELAAEIAPPDLPTEAHGAALLVGDLNLNDPRSAADAESVRQFEARTRVRLAGGHCAGGTWLGSLLPGVGPGPDDFFYGADLDRVGATPALEASHALEVRCVEVEAQGLRLSDHRGLRIRMERREPPDGTGSPGSPAGDQPGENTSG